ncbi:hypothetical protein ACU4GD_32855 [Cupriavidus basilensis]
MAALTIKDLFTNRTLDGQAMAAIRGGVLLGIRLDQPYTPPRASTLPIVNFYEINNSFYADQMVNQFQNIDVRNSAPGANINVQAGQGARNDGRM